MFFEQKIDRFGFVYLKFFYGIIVECELGGIEIKNKGINQGSIVVFKNLG